MIDAIGVAIPARDEAASIGACLTSIAAAAAEVAVPVIVVVAADACGDDTTVVTSARLISRTVGGFATFLAVLAAES